MKVFKGFFIAIFVLIIVFLIITLFLPSKFEVKRTIEINAPTTIVYYLFDDLRNWKYWDAWFPLDTNQIRTYGGPLIGKGSYFTWKSQNRNVGTGKVEIESEDYFKSISYRFTFGENIQSDAKVLFTNLNGKTKVEWQMEGEFKFLAKWFRFFIDQTAGRDFEIGLANVKKLSENAVANKVLFFVDSLQPFEFLYIYDSCLTQGSEISKKYAEIFATLDSFVVQTKIEYYGYPISVMKGMSKDGQKFYMEAGFPIKSVGAVTNSEIIKIRTLNAGKVIRAVALSSYSQFHEVYAKIQDYFARMKLSPNVAEGQFEMYVTDPTLVPENENITVIYTPIK